VAQRNLTNIGTLTVPVHLNSHSVTGTFLFRQQFTAGFLLCFAQKTADVRVRIDEISPKQWGKVQAGSRSLRLNHSQLFHESDAACITTVLKLYWCL
jgi:hypothetical protein